MTTATAPAVSRATIQDRLDGLTETPLPSGDFNKRGLQLERLLMDLIQRTARVAEADEPDVGRVMAVVYEQVRETIVREIDERGMAR